MKVNVPVKIGDSKLTVELEVKDLMEVSDVLGFYHTLPKVCSECNSSDLYLNRREVKNFTFNGLKCAKCGAELKFGSLKAGGFFTRRGQKFEKYVDKSFNQEKEEDIEI